MLSVLESKRRIKQLIRDANTAESRKDPEARKERFCSSITELMKDIRKATAHFRKQIRSHQKGAEANPPSGGNTSKASRLIRGKIEGLDTCIAELALHRDELEDFQAAHCRKDSKDLPKKIKFPDYTPPEGEDGIRDPRHPIFRKLSKFWKKSMEIFYSAGAHNFFRQIIEWFASGR